jgi:small-conductance mechanosensitive channel/CRP-like cAMP-binding protein
MNASADGSSGVGLIVALVASILGLLLFIVVVRKKPVGLGFFAACFGAVVILALLEMLKEGIGPKVPPIVLSWVAFSAYTTLAFVLLKTADLLLVEDYLIQKRRLYIPQVLRLMLLLIGVLLAGLLLLRLVLRVDLVALIALPTVATAVVGFALKDVIARFASGITLGRQIRMGDWVTLMGKEGTVTDTNLNYITIRTRSWDHVMLPNDAVSQAEIVNHSRPESLHARTLSIEAGYGHPPADVKRLLTEAAAAVPGVVAEPQPISFIGAYKESGIEYMLRFWLKDYERVETIAGDVLAYVWYAFKRHGIQFPFPQRVVHMTKDTDLAEARQAELAVIRHQLRAVDFLSVLDEQELTMLADGAHTRIYQPGETVVREGEAGEELFVVTDGDASVEIRSGDQTTPVATLQAGKFFGEMSLLTGAPRAATVRAKSPLTVLVVGKGSMRKVISHNQNLVERFGEVLASRQSALASSREAASRATRQDTGPADGKSLKRRILQFFRLTHP